MKKIFALLLALTMLCGSCALAEQQVTLQKTNDFEVTAVVPAGYSMEETRDEDGNLYLTFTPDDETKTFYVVSIAPSEEYEGVTLNEMSDEDKKALLDVMTADFAAPEIHDMTTDAGTEVYLYNETVDSSEEADTSYALGFTVYKGFFFQVYAVRGTYDALTQEDLDLAMRILSDIWFVKEK